MACLPPKPSDKMLRLFTSCGLVGTANKIGGSSQSIFPGIGVGKPIGSCRNAKWQPK
jgi:hypothetical protein